MKIKTLLIVTAIITILTAGNGFSATIGTWFGCPAPDPNQPAGDANRPACVPGTGSWKGVYWNKERINLPAGPGNSSNEIKIIRAKTVCTLDSDAGNYLCKLSIAGGGEEANAPRLEIVTGGQIGIGEFRVGCGGATASGPVGCVNQTGGTVKLANNLLIGRYGTSSTNPNEGKGFYTISGGTITCDAANTKGGLYIGASSGEPTEGTFTVAGNSANISFKKLYIANNTGSVGTVAFKIGPAGVNPIRVSDNISIDEAAAASTAKLIVSAIGEPPKAEKADILLIENQGSGPVNGVFDTVNGIPAPEGAGVILSFGGNNYNYNLTYKGGIGNNDIMLRYVPAPAAPAAVTPAATEPPAPPAPAAP